MNFSKKEARALAIGLGIGGLLTGSYWLFRKRHQQSLSAYTVNQALKSFDVKEKTDLLVHEHLEESIQILTQENRKLTNNPFAAFFTQYQEWNFEGMQVMDWNSNGDKNQDILLVFHGGGYLFEPMESHFLTANSVAKRSGRRVIMPLYPRAPEYTFKDAFPRLVSLYKHILEEKGDEARLSIMGDSAGGGLALGFTYYLIDQKLPQPEHLILLSPWLNLKNDHPKIKEANETEAFFGIDGLDAASKAWVEDPADLEHPYVSPKFGDLSQIESYLSVYVGTDETFYVDILDFIEELKALDKDFDYEIAPGQNHVYVSYPTVEGAQARRKIGDLLA